MKKEYKKLTIEIVGDDNVNVITTSGPEPTINEEWTPWISSYDTDW